jgi:hypothetical protein
MRCIQTYYETLPFAHRCRGILKCNAPGYFAGWDRKPEKTVKLVCLFVVRLFIDTVKISVYMDLLLINL